MPTTDWRQELADRVRDGASLALARGRPAPEGLDELASELGRRGLLPFAATPCFLALAEARADPGRDPILLQALPSPEELVTAPGELADPLGEALHRASGRAVHQYGSRILLRATGDCPVFCRHCFRRNLLAAERGFMSEDEIEAAAALIASSPALREVLVSGGDPLTASDDRLEGLFARLRAARPGISIRVCTRAPVTLPARITPGLVDLFRRYRPLRVVIQCNHPRELSGACAAALGSLVDAGIAVRTQTVLLRGVNDEAETLEELFARLTALGADPYYLFQGDLAAGTARFRVSLSRGLAIYAELRRRLSGLELPRYAVDAPGGGGKVYLPEGIAGRRGSDWLLATPSGGLATYPEEA